VKIWDPELRLACDMNVNNPIALENTDMIRTYVDIDPRVRPLAMIIKYWAKRRILNEPGMYDSMLPNDLDVDFFWFGSTWINSELLHLDLHDYQLSPDTQSTNFTESTATTEPKAKGHEWY
jgi:hypothetical protein